MPQLPQSLEAVIGEDLTAEAVVAWLHKNADSVCRLLRGAGPEEVDKLRSILTRQNLNDRAPGFAGVLTFDDLRDTILMALAALGGKADG